MCLGQLAAEIQCEEGEVGFETLSAATAEIGT